MKHQAISSVLVVNKIERKTLESHICRAQAASFVYSFDTSEQEIQDVQPLTSSVFSAFCDKKKVIETKKKKCHKNRGVRALRDQGHGGGGCSEQGMAITGSDEGDGAHYWQLCPL